MLLSRPALTAEERRVFDGIEQTRTALRHQVRSVPVKWTRGLRTFLTADAVASACRDPATPSACRRRPRTWATPPTAA